MRRLFALLTAFAIAFALSLTMTALAEDESLIADGTFDNATSTSSADWYEDVWLSGDEDYLIEFVQDGFAGNSVHIVNYCENDTKLCQTISVEPDTAYKFSAMVKFSSVEYGSGANISVLNTVVSSDALKGTGDWRQIEFVGKTAADQTEITVAVRVGGYGNLSIGEAWFDNVTAVKLDTVPENCFDLAENSAPQNTEAGEGIPYFGYGVILLLFTAAASLLTYRKMKNTNDFPVEAQDKKQEKYTIILILLFALIIRVLLSLLIVGHMTDIGCFMAWSNLMVETGPAGFYTSGMFADYPPGYMYVLWFMGLIARLFNLAADSPLTVLLIKLPSILSDLVFAYIAYKLAEKCISIKRFRFILLVIIALNPMFAFISGGWGQIDMVLSVLIVAVLYLFINKKLIFAGALYGLAILIKPQALMIGPILAVAYFAEIFSVSERHLYFNKKRFFETVLSVLAAALVIVLLSLPFSKGQSWDWLLDKYFSTATSYPYASIEAFNFMSLIGANWKPAAEKMFIFSYATWGTVFICLSACASAILFFVGKRDNKGKLFLVMAFLISAIFTFGHYMHERYLFPALPLIIMAFIYYHDRRLIKCFFGFTFSTLLNALAAIVIVANQEARGTQYDVITILGSAITVAVFIYFAYVCFDIIVLKRIKEFSAPQKEEKLDELAEISENFALPMPYQKPKMTRKDRLLCVCLTIIYAVIALVNLGTTKSPETAWKGNRNSSPITFSFGEDATISEIRVFGGIAEGTVSISDEQGVLFEYKQINEHMFRWHKISIDEMHAENLMLNVVSGKVWFNEIAFFDEEHKLIIPEILTEEADGKFLVDEPEQIPGEPSYLNGMYFDELYHARTAYEHLNGMKPYENSHPPLGKVFIALGIAVFGMNAFGWRIVGTLFGIAMVPIMYVFAKRLFKRSEFALLTAVLFTFDFMHFTQTRIATIDVYGVFFIILMYYYMYNYYCRNFYADGLYKTLKPLAMGGIMFGLGAASKWICFYAGAGMAVILFTSLGQRFAEYLQLRKSEKPEEVQASKKFFKYLILTLLWCCLFYIVIPAAIYLLSYLPYIYSDTHYTIFGQGNSVWSVQEFMFSYHSGLTATHPYQSAWYSWPFIIRPMWYYISESTATGYVSTISAMGNPAVWMPCTIGTAVLLYKIFACKIKMNPGIFVALVGLGANFLPWVLVTRCTFIYHFFASVPFIIILAVYLIKSMVERNEKNMKWVWAWIIAAVALFALFYPVISGLEVSEIYVKCLKWLPSWVFMF